MIKKRISIQRLISLSYFINDISNNYIKKFYLMDLFTNNYIYINKQGKLKITI